MAVIFPIDSLLSSQRELGLILAVVIGFGFGFSLERAGFGRAKKLAAQFYLYDMTVFKVMFSAIVTAMLGVILLSGLGWADLQAISDYATSATFLWPMLIGGLLLGAGFIIAGYCPGTSIVAAASGNLDGLVAFTGVIVGSTIYSEALDAFPALGSFHSSGNLGHLYLYAWLGIPAPVLALAVAVMAVGCFIGAEKLEAVFRKRLEGSSRGVIDTRSNPIRSNARRFAFASFVLFAVSGLVAYALPVLSPGGTDAAAPQVISVSELARGVLERPWQFRIIDIREMADCAANRIPGSECVPAAKLPELELQDAPGVRPLVLIGQGLISAIPEGANRYPGPVRILEGGFATWKAFALTSPEFPGSGATEAALQEYRLRSSLHAALTGMKQVAPPPPAPSSGGGFKKKTGGGGCSG